MHSFILALGTLRAPIFVSLLAAGLLLVPAQSHEIFLALQEAEGTNFAIGLCQAIASALSFILVLAGSSFLLLKTATPYRDAAVNCHRSLLDALSLGLPLAVFLSIVLSNIDLGGSLAGKRNHIVAAAALIWVLVVALLFNLHAVRHRLASLGLGVVSPLSRLKFWPGSVVAAAVIAFLISAIVAYPRQFANFAGPTGVVFLFLSVLCIALSLLAHIYDRYQIPVIGILSVAAVAWAYIPTNDNHQIRLTATNAADAQDVTLGYKEWLLSRPDLSDYKNRPYPVYIVTAEGGGLYAAVHAAWTLARIQDNCPAFARHIFAISGVSGGSLGAALFAALVKAYPSKRDLKPEEKCPLLASVTGTMQLAVQSYFKEDLLTPLLAAALFPDFFQRFWPWPIEAFDRARALEQSFEEAWRKVVPKNRPDVTSTFAQTSRDMWSAQEDQPALLLNATLVQNGERVIIAPFKLRNASAPIFVDRFVDLLNENYSTSLATAVSVSARFPLVTPPALHRHREFGLAAQLVDGGYYENSGVFTAINLIDRIHQVSPASTDAVPGGIPPNAELCAPRNLVAINTPTGETANSCVKLITIRAASLAQRDFSGGDVFSLFAAVYQVRAAKGNANLALANNLLCGGTHCGLGRMAYNPHIYAKYIDTEKLKLPLGWYISNRSLRAVIETERNSVDCSNPHGLPPKRSGVTRDQAAAEENTCLYWRIANDLTER